jgi:hypothetical protein
MAIAESAEQAHRVVEQRRVRIERRQHPPQHIGDVPTGPVRRQIVTQSRKGLLHIPFGQGREFGITLQDHAHLTQSEQVDATRETAAFTPGALGQTTNAAERPTKKTHRLAGLGEIPLTNADCLIVLDRHGIMLDAGMHRRIADKSV